ARTSEPGIDRVARALESVAVPVPVALDLAGHAGEEPGREDPVRADGELFEPEIDPCRLGGNGSAAGKLRHHLDARVVVRRADEEARKPETGHLQAGSGSFPAVEGDLAFLRRSGQSDTADKVEQRAHAHRSSWVRIKDRQRRTLPARSSSGSRERRRRWHFEERVGRSGRFQQDDFEPRRGDHAPRSQDGMRVRGLRRDDAGHVARETARLHQRFVRGELASVRAGAAVALGVASVMTTAAGSRSGCGEARKAQRVRREEPDADDRKRPAPGKGQSAREQAGTAHVRRVPGRRCRRQATHFPQGCVQRGWYVLPRGTMTLADLVDLEAQLARDRSADPAALEGRDTGSFPEAPRDRGVLVARWLQARRDAEPGQLYPGRAVANVLRGIRAALLIAGLVLGWTAATAVLRYTGEQPVNAWDFLLVFVGLQLLLFAFLIASFLFPVAALGTPLFGLFRGLVAAVYPRLAARAVGANADRLAEWRALWRLLRSRRSLYHHLEPWILLGLTQSFGVAFNVGALLGCLRR